MRGATVKKINILKYPWHIAHDYELFKLKHNFFMLNGTHRAWENSYRPLPSSLKFVYNIDEQDTDLMILHVDQWIFNEPDKLRLFNKLNKAYKKKKIIINHGCNLVDGASSEQMQDLLGDNYVVCNSSTANNLWGLPNSRYIHHGLSADEWEPSNYGNNNIIVIQPPGKMHEKFRNNTAVTEFEARHQQRVTWVGRDKTFKSFNEYRSFLSTSSIAFFPSYASPNPRARTECMLSGLPVITTNSQGEGRYIVNEENGFASNNMSELYDYMLFLKNTPTEVARIGANARKTAENYFGVERFQAEWNNLIGEVCNGPKKQGNVSWSSRFSTVKKRQPVLDETANTVL